MTRRGQRTLDPGFDADLLGEPGHGDSIQQTGVKPPLPANRNPLYSHLLVN